MQNHYEDPAEDDSVDLQKIIRNYLYLWPWFILSVIICLGLAYIYNSFKHKEYENNLTLLIFEEEPLLKLNENIAAAFSNSGSKIQNEIEILTSKTLISQTLSSLDFFIEYHQVNSFINEELYPNPYFTIEFDSIWPQPLNVPIKLTLEESGQWKIVTDWDKAELYSFATQQYIGIEEKSQTEVTVASGQWVEQSNLRFRVVENPVSRPDAGSEFVVYFRDINTLLDRYKEIDVLEIKNSTLLKLTLKGRSSKKNATFLNKHAENFLMRELDKRNYRAQLTIDFIEEQLNLVAQSLSHSESNLEDFRSSEQILNLDFQAQRSFTQLEQLQQERTALHVKEKYYKYLESYLDQVGKTGTDLIAPSSLGVDDPLLSGLIQDLMELYNERSEVMINSRRDNPYIANLEGRIDIMKNTMRESVKNINQANTMAMADLEERIDELSEKISTIPESQRNLINIERQFNLHDHLFTFLQSKKSEIEITKAGFTPVHEIIDKSTAISGVQVSPKPMLTYYIAIFIGLLIPVILVFLYDFFNDKVRSSEEIEKLTTYPILGYISRDTSGTNSQKLVSFDKHSILAESFRSIRTNAQFVLPHEDKPVMLVTSTLMEEGKTFASLNLAAGYASMGKKAVLLSFDLRKPRLHKYLDVDAPAGLSNYLSSDLLPADIVTKGPVDNLDIVHSGQIPPNPAELLNSPKMNELFSYMKTHYDIILVDTPPVGMVADALLLLRYVNVIVYIVRHNNTPTKYLQQTLRNLKDKDIKNVNIVLNDIPAPGRFNYYNAYGYQYGYFDKDLKKAI